jgi:hypothetical protein
MDKQKFKAKRKEWLRRYIGAEIIGTILALAAAWIVYIHTKSFVAATAAGWVGEGIGFYGYFITTELITNTKRFGNHRLFKRITFAISAASTNLFVEFMLAEILDNLLLRPYLMYLLPHYIHPYPLGFLAGKFSADIIFYTLAIVAYEARKHWLHR